MDKNGQKPQARQQSILPMILVVFIDMIGIGIVIPLLAPLLVSQNELLHEGTPLETRVLVLGLLLAAYSLAQFFGAPILGALSDRHGRKPVLIAAVTATMLGYILFAYGIYTHSLWLLFIGRIIDGFVGGSISVSYSAIADLSDQKSKPKNFGMIGMAFGFGFIIGPFLGGKLADPSILPWFNFATPFIFTAILAFVNLLMVIFMFKETNTHRSHAKISIFTGVRNISKAFTLPSLRTLFLVIFLLAFGFSFFTQFSQVFLIEQFGFGQSQIGDFFAFVGVCVALVQGLVTRPVSARFTPEQVLRVVPLGLALTVGAMLLIHNTLLLYATVPFMALFQGLTYPNYTTLVSNKAGKESQGEIFGINQSIQSMALFLPPIISGFIGAIHYTLPVIAGAFFIFCGWVCFLFFFRQKKAEVFHEV